MVEGASTLRKMKILSGVRRRIRKYIHFTMVEVAYALCKMKKLSGLRRETHEFTNGRRHLWDL